MTSRDTQTEAEMVSIGEVARLLGVSVDTVRRWERAGRIHAHRTAGGQRRFPASEVDRVRGTTEASPRVAEAQVVER